MFGAVYHDLLLSVNYVCGVEHYTYVCGVEHYVRGIEHSLLERNPRARITWTSRVIT